MKTMIDNIKVAKRIRKEITKIDELAADIERNGLLNPVTVMSTDSRNFKLLAGFRRLKAVEKLGWDEVEVNIVSPADAEAAVMIEISENEQREPFTFSEKMDFARILEEIEKEKALERKSLGGKGGLEQHTPQVADVKKGETREIVAEKIGMGKTNYDRAKYIVDNAPDEIIEELDSGKRAIRPTYDELKAKETVEPPPKPPKKSSEAWAPSKADLEAVERNMRFNAMSAEEKVVELQRQRKEESIRAITAESELKRLKEFHDNLNYHKDGIIANLQKRLDKAEAYAGETEKLLEEARERIKELEDAMARTGA